MLELNPTAASLLGFLHHGPMTGYDLSQTAEMVIGSFWSITRSQVYRELSRMEDHGYLIAEDPGARDRRPFRLTDEGRDAFRRWSEMTPGDATIRIPFLLAVALGAFHDRTVLDDHLAHHRDEHEQRRDEYELMAEAADVSSGADPWSRATLAFGLAYEQMVLDWFDRLPDLLPDT